MRGALVLLFALIFSLLLTACDAAPTSSPEPLPSPPPPASSPTPGRLAVPTAVPTPQAQIPFGVPERPILFALPPAQDGIVSEPVQQVLLHLSHLTALTILPYVPTSYHETVDGLTQGLFHLAWVSPLAYLLAHQQGQADIALTSIVLGRERRASQFLVNRALVQNRTFTLYYDPLTAANLADSTTALAQFAGARPCWPDPYSPTGYIVPLGLLHQNNIQTKPGAFLQGHTTVVKALYQDVEGLLCQFGATVADERIFLATELPDVAQRVAIVWMSDPIVPFDGIAYAAALPDELRARLTAAFLSMAQTEEGLSALRQAFQIDGLKPVDDTFYWPLRAAVDQADLSLDTLIR